MILKSFLKYQHEKGLSSFMCKNILLLCIEKTPNELWCASNLLTVVTLCLKELQTCILHKYCPHFIERHNNLMSKRFSHVLRIWLLEQVQSIIQSKGRALLEITIDDLGRRLQSKFNPVNVMVNSIVTPAVIAQEISSQAIFGISGTVNVSHLDILDSLLSGDHSWINILQIVARLSFQGSDLERVACSLLQPVLFSNFGCVLASSSLQQCEAISPDALTWIHEGLNSDVASGRLKLASVFYAVRDFNNVYDILRRTEEIYDTGLVAAACTCFFCTRRSLRISKILCLCRQSQ
jgi:hypothetical protein